MLRTRRDIYLLILNIFISAIVLTITKFAGDSGDKILQWPIWFIVLLYAPYLIIIALLAFMIWKVVKNIINIDKIEDEENKLVKAKIDTIVNKLGITPKEINKIDKSNNLKSHKKSKK